MKSASSRCLTSLSFALLFAGCGAQTQLPSAALSQNQPLGVRLPQVTNACSISTGWKFGGPCVSVTIARKGTVATLPRYKGFTVSVLFPPVSAADQVGQQVAVHVAIGKGDVTGKLAGKPFQPLKHGTAFLYLAIENTGAISQFASDQAIDVRAAKSTLYPSRFCQYGILDSPRRQKWDFLDNGQFESAKELIYTRGPGLLLPSAQFYGFSC
jgi:hypothetical protein